MHSAHSLQGCRKCLVHILMPITHLDPELRGKSRLGFIEAKQNSTFYKRALGPIPNIGCIILSETSEQSFRYGLGAKNNISEQTELISASGMDRDVR